VVATTLGAQQIHAWRSRAPHQPSPVAASEILQSPAPASVVQPPPIDNDARTIRIDEPFVIRGRLLTH
jgi:hypothetical protein